GVNGNTKLKGFAHAGCLYATPDAAPERCVQKDHIDSGIQSVCRQLLKVHDDGICSKRNAHHFPRAPHSIQAKDGIFKIVVLQPLDRLTESYGLFGGPHSIRIKPERIPWKGCGQGTINLEFVVGMKDTALNFVRGESVFLLEFACVTNHLFDRAYFV